MKKYIIPCFGLVFSLFFLLSPISTFASSTLVIDEFSIGKTGAADDEYIVIANHGAEAAKIDGYNLRLKRKSTDLKEVIDSTIYTFSTTGNKYLKPGERVVVAKSNYSELETPYRYSTYISSNYTLYLKNEAGGLVDLVGYGTCPEYETEPISLVKADEVWRRMNGQDTDYNSMDFYNVNAPKPEETDVNSDKLVISELYPNPKTGEKEWFEIFNPTSLRVSLAGLKVCDGMGSIHCYYFDKGSFIEPLNYKLFNQIESKITLNDKEDFLALYDLDDNLIFSTGAYQGADDGNSLSLIGSKWVWSGTATPEKENIFQDIIEVEEETVKPKKPKTVSKATAKLVPVETTVDEDVPVEPQEQKVVKGAAVVENKAESKPKISNRIVGLGLIVLAIIGVIIYTILEFKDKIYDFYNKISRRDH